MNKFLCLGIWMFALLVVPVVSEAAVTPDATTNFITTWNTENSGASANNQITIPGSGSGYSYEIYWEDMASSTINGTTSVTTSSSYTLTFPTPGIYEVQIAGAFPIIRFNNGGDKEKILTVEQWGAIAWTSMSGAFRGASTLRIPATDAPNLSGVTDMSNMLRDAVAFNDPIDHWNVSNVTNISHIFSGASNFNQALNDWDVSNVVNFSNVFTRAPAFNQPLFDWDTSSATNMNFMFYSFDSGAFLGSAFNQDISSWDVSKVTSFSFMFGGATSFNQSINSWNTASGTTMTYMFQYAAYNQPLDNWDVSQVTNFSGMFQSAAFNQNIAGWDTSSAVTMRDMFEQRNPDYDSPVPFTVAFNQDISGWDVSTVTDLLNMFQYNKYFDQNLGPWDVSSVTTMEDMFIGTSMSTANQDVMLQSWSQQSLESNVPFHLGTKSYSSVGASAIDTLRTTYNWTVDEEYKAQYEAQSGATLVGTSLQRFITSGSSTVAVEVIPDKKCDFVQWSDGGTQNPRTDTLTDNLYVIAEISCSGSTQSTSARTQREKKEQFGSASTSSQSLQSSLDKVKALPDFSNLDPVKDKETINQLIELLLELVKALTLLLAGVEQKTT